MQDPTSWSLDKKYNYIFKDPWRHQREPPICRFDIIEKWLLGDIRTYLLGMAAGAETKATLGLASPWGGGNFGLAILLCTAIDLVSDLYAGKTRCLSKTAGEQHPSERKAAKKFVKQYFPEGVQEIWYMLWDGVRNGLTHLFLPNLLRYKHEGKMYSIYFWFVVDEGRQPLLKLWKTQEGDLVHIKLNVRQLWIAFQKGFQAYKTDLETSSELQDAFIRVWRCIEENPKHVNEDKDCKHYIGECGTLIDRLLNSRAILIYVDPDTCCGD